MRGFTGQTQQIKYEKTSVESSAISPSFAFFDDSNFIWAKDAIDNWSSMGYISGYDGQKARSVLITREEFEAKYGISPEGY